MWKEYVPIGRGLLVRSMFGAFIRTVAGSE
jgi:hypothetical protein